MLEVVLLKAVAGERRMTADRPRTASAALMPASIRLAAVLVISGLAVCAAVAAHEQQIAVDTPVPSVRAAALKDGAPCDLWRTVEHISRFARVPVGFEHTANCAPQGWGRRPEADAAVLDGLTPRRMFDQLVAARPDYAWKEIDGVVVLRPVVAWQDTANVLARPVAPFAVTNRRPHDLLHDVFRATRPPLFQPHDDSRLSPETHSSDPPAAIDRHVNLNFAGGTLLQTLNAVTRTTGARWELGYWGHPQVTLYAATYDGGATSVPMRMPR